jgi:hypothetical protein
LPGKRSHAGDPPIGEPVDAQRSGKKAIKTDFLLALARWFRVKSSPVRLEFIGGIKIVIDGETQL